MLELVDEEAAAPVGGDDGLRADPTARAGRRPVAGRVGVFADRCAIRVAHAAAAERGGAGQHVVASDDLLAGLGLLGLSAGARARGHEAGRGGVAIEVELAGGHLVDANFLEAIGQADATAFESVEPRVLGAAFGKRRAARRHVLLAERLDRLDLNLRRGVVVAATGAAERESKDGSQTVGCETHAHTPFLRKGRRGSSPAQPKYVRAKIPFLAAELNISEAAVCVSSGPHAVPARIREKRGALLDKTEALS